MAGAFGAILETRKLQTLVFTFSSGRVRRSPVSVWLGNQGFPTQYRLAPGHGVGWRGESAEAPAGTVIELLVQEAHEPGRLGLMNTHFYSWTRFVCREGTNHFETFDFESCRWVQLHVRGGPATVLIRDVGMRRRVFPWPVKPHVQISDPNLQRLMDANINTLNNCAQETVMDGGGRERQQYSGDCSHQLHAIHLVLGERRLPARFLST